MDAQPLHRTLVQGDFDPDIVDAFVAVQADLQAIARRFADAEIDEAAEAERLRLILG